MSAHSKGFSFRVISYNVTVFNISENKWQKLQKRNAYHRGIIVHTKRNDKTLFDRQNCNDHFRMYFFQRNHLFEFNLSLSVVIFFV